MQRLLRIAVVVGAFLPGALAAQDMDPVGLYEWEVDVDGQYMYGTFDIKMGEEGLAGTAVSDDGESRISKIEVAGSTLSFTAHTASFGDVYIELRVEGERFTGFASVGGEQVPMSGTKSGG